jgi:PAS domain-containing protein
LTWPQVDPQDALESALKAEHQPRSIIDTIRAMVWSTRPDGSAEFLNQRWLDYTGLAAEQAMGWAMVNINPRYFCGTIRVIC